MIGERTAQRREGREKPGREIRTQAETVRARDRPARKLIDQGQRREDMAALLNVDRTTLLPGDQVVW